MRNPDFYWKVIILLDEVRVLGLMAELTDQYTITSNREIPGGKRDSCAADTKVWICFLWETGADRHSIKE